MPSPRPDDIHTSVMTIQEAIDALSAQLPGRWRLTSIAEYDIGYSGSWGCQASLKITGSGRDLQVRGNGGSANSAFQDLVKNVKAVAESSCD